MKVAVVGCGLAGIRSAMLLEEAGREVSLFEARDRPGGRLHTAESGFEEGAEWIDHDHRRMRSLLRLLGIGEVPAPPGEYVLQFAGSRCMADRPWPFAATDAFRFENMAESAIASHEETVGDLVAASCQSQEGRWLVSANIRTDEGDEPARLGLAQWLDFRRMYSERAGDEASAFRIEGGGTRLIEAMLLRVGTSPRYGARLLGVHEADQVELHFEGFRFTADAVVLALPLPCLLELDITPPLYNDYALRSLGFAEAVKSRFRFESPFWVDEGWSGYMKSDLRIQQTWPDRTEANCLIGYMVGDAARFLHMAPMPEVRLSEEWRRWPADISPDSIEVKDWTADPYARGCFATTPPGSDPAGARRRQPGRVQVAGEFAATWMGFMEGALESAEEAVGAIRESARG